MSKKRLIYLICFLQIAFFYGWFLIEKSDLHSPQNKDVLLETVLKDPRDLLRGDYMVLNYKISSSRTFSNYKKFSKYRGKIYAILKKEGQYYQADYLSKNKLSKIKKKQIIIEAKKTGYSQIEYGIEKYFFNKKEQIENSDILARISPNGKIRIKQLVKK